MDNLDEHNTRLVARKLFDQVLPRIYSGFLIAIMLFIFWFTPQITFCQTNHLEVEGNALIAGALHIRDTLPSTKNVVNNYSVKFDGSNDHLNIANAASLNFGLGPATIGCWFRSGTVSFTFQVPLIGNYKTITAATFGIYLVGTDQEDNGKINVFYRNSDSSGEASLPSTLRVDDDEWHSVFAVKDTVEGRLLLYIDGQLDTTRNIIVGNNDSGQGFTSFGNHLGKYMSGYVDNINIWNIALDSTEIANYHICLLEGNESGLVCFLDLEEGSNTTANDQTINGNNGTLTNGPLWDVNTTTFGSVSHPILKVENGDIDVVNPENGVILTSPNGKKWRVRIDNNGNLSVEQVG